jgi:prepilin-type N-terminal cleavage/methylation domain-containing protein
MSRGMTLVELLLALTLMASTMAAVLSWTRTTAEAETAMTKDSRWRRSAHALMRSIHDDVRTGDLHPAPAEGEEQPEPRIIAIDGSVTINTRSPASRTGQAFKRYALSQGAVLLEISEQEGGERGRLLTSPLVLGDVSELDCELVDGALRVRLASTSGIEVERLMEAGP